MIRRGFDLLKLDCMNLLKSRWGLKLVLVFLIGVILVAPSIAQSDKGASIEISCDRDDAIYRSGEPITLKIKLLKDGQPFAGKKVYFRISINEQVEENVFKSSAETQCVAFTANAPGFVTCEANYMESEPVWLMANAAISVGVEPEKIKAQTPCPPDFMDFWNRQKARLADIPMKASSQPVEIKAEHLKKMVKAFDVKIDCAGPLPVTAYIAMPIDADKDKRYPAQVSFHGYTLFPLSGSGLLLPQAALGKMICADVNPHGMENGRPEEYYKSEVWPKLRTRHGAYPYLDWDDPEKVYFNGMFLRVLRSLEYVKSLPEWDGRTLIVEGSSMGGSQALVAAALDPQVTLCIANVPALCDNLSKTQGWPRLVAEVKYYQSLVRKNAPYYDMVNFAPQIKAPTVIGVGFWDFTCPPANVWAIYNNLQCSKQIANSPKGIHNWNKEMLDLKEAVKKKN